MREVIKRARAGAQAPRASENPKDRERRSIPSCYIAASEHLGGHLDPDRLSRDDVGSLLGLPPSRLG